LKFSGGPEIAFRGGRVDALEPNVAGVPEPQQDLDSHIASFARQGFTQTEMIGLVACGCVRVFGLTAYTTYRAHSLVLGTHLVASNMRRSRILCQS
jgi:hypothetical protein